MSIRTWFIERLVKTAYPDRDISVEQIGRHIFLVTHDNVGCNTYSLEGTYNYNQVQDLNALTGCKVAGFGYCEELGPVAFIGIPNPKCANSSGYFKYKVLSYGSTFEEPEVKFNAYSDEIARKIGNYTVYGLQGCKEVAKIAPIQELNATYDSRQNAKRSSSTRIFDMDCKLKGIYNYNEARLLATGTLEEKDGYSGEDHPIVFGVLETGKYVGIINMWPCDKKLVRGFRDVWEYGRNEPMVQNIMFLSETEASKVKDFYLYVYNYSSSGNGRPKYPIEKFDRTLDPRFNFHLPDGSDYRLIEHTELFVQE